MTFFEYIGRIAIRLVEEIGSLAIFCYDFLFWLFRRPFFIRQLFKQMEFIGVRSVTVVLLTGMFTGMVGAPSDPTVSAFSGRSLVGSTTALGLLRELGCARVSHGHGQGGLGHDGEIRCVGRADRR